MSSAAESHSPAHPRPAAAAAPAPAAAAAPAEPRRGAPRATLFWRVFGTNAAVLTAACLITVLVVSPGYVSTGEAAAELGVLAAAIAAMLALDAVLARRALAPLRRLTTFAQELDPLTPPQRLELPGGPSEATELARAFNEMRDRLVDERRESVRRALKAQEGERLRVSQELHDEVGQALTSVVLQLGRTAKRVPADYRAEVVDAQEIARASLEEVRRISQQLRPEALDDLGLASALRVFGDRLADQTELTLEFALDDRLPELTPEAELVVYRVTQEALTNVVRHAGATRAMVSLRALDGRLELRVQDDGPREGRLREGGGIRGMRERAVLVGATLAVRRRQGGLGTEVVLSLPLGGGAP